MDSIEVRFAEIADTTYVSKDGYIPPEIVARKIEFQEIIIAKVKGEPKGYLRLEYLWSIIPYISLISVDQRHRQQGIGKALLEFIMEYLRGKGHTWLYSSSQADEPEPQSWHRHMGFRDCGIITGINSGGVSELFFRISLNKLP